MGRLVTVCGSVGGIGASSLAYAVALQAGPGAVVIDAQSDGVPLDVLIGAETSTGARWSQVHIRSAEIGADVITAALPAHHGLRVLAADQQGVADAAAVGYLVDALRGTATDVVIDLPSRHPLRQTLHPDVDLLLITPTLPGIVAAKHALLPDTLVIAVDTGFAHVSLSRAAEHLGRTVLGPVRWQPAVSMAATAGVPIPRTTDLMRMAAYVLGGVDDGV